VLLLTRFKDMTCIVSRVKVQIMLYIYELWRPGEQLTEKHVADSQMLKLNPV